MRKIIDTFLHFIADNSDTSVHPLRNSPSDPTAGVLQMDAINISVLDFHPNLGRGTTRVAMDVVCSDDLTAMDVVGSLSELLAAYSTPLMDYTSGSPVLAGGNVFWDRSGVRFQRINTDQYSHYLCVLSLRHQ